MAQYQLQYNLIFESLQFLPSTDKLLLSRQDILIPFVIQPLFLTFMYSKKTGFKYVQKGIQKALKVPLISF
jgi:hypothetical protein